MKNTIVKDTWACRIALAGLSLAALPVLADQPATNMPPATATEATPAMEEQAADISDSGTLAAPTEQAGAKTPPAAFSTGFVEQFNTGVANGGTVSIARFNVGIKAPAQLTDALRLTTTFRFNLDNYDFRSEKATWNGAWQNIGTYTLASIMQGKLDDEWSVYFGGVLRQSGELEGTKFKDGITGGGLGGVVYKFSDTLSVGAGLGIVTQLEDHATVLPILSVDWKFADSWRLKVGLTDIGTTGYGAELIYDLNQDWSFALGLQHHRSRFRVEGQNEGVPSTTSNGIGQEQASNIYLSSTWHACTNADLVGYFGVTTGGNIRLENQHGTQEAGIGESSKYNSAAILGVKAVVRF
jgi:hypothetical protein